MTIHSIYQVLYDFIANFLPETGFESTTMYIAIGFGIAIFLGFCIGLWRMFKYIIRG